MDKNEKIQSELTAYRWTQKEPLTPETRQWLIDDIRENGDRPETVPELQETSDGQLFLLWLRS